MILKWSKALVNPSETSQHRTLDLTEIHSAFLNTKLSGGKT